MTAPITRSIVCPVLIGRRSHLDSLVKFIEQAHSGHGQTVLVSGEAGIGKSRLIAEAIKYTRASHSQTASPTTLILEGRCFEPDRSLPYAPFLDLLRTFFSLYAQQDLAALLGSTATKLAKLLPEFAAFVPELAPASALDPEQEKHRLFWALLHFFTHQSTLQPLVIVIEDIHWSDDASLECLLFLTRHIASLPILLLLTYRNEEEHPALLSFLGELERGRLTTELTLSHLTIDEVEAMIRIILGLSHAVSADFIAAVYALTEGNPFFIEEVLKSLVASGEVTYHDGKWEIRLRESESSPAMSLPSHPHLPRSTLFAVQQRLNHLSVEAREVLSFAAVVGRHFDFILLQRLTGRNEADLVRLVKELIIAQMIVDESEDVLAFRHALTRQAAYTDLLARERRSLHHSAAQTIEHIYANTLDAQYERALSNAETGLNIATEIEHGPWMATGYRLLGIISLELLALPIAQQHLEHALTLAKECGSLFLLGHAAAFLASTCIAQGEYARAEEILNDVFGPRTTLSDAGTATRLVRSCGTGVGPEPSRQSSRHH